MGYLPPSLRRLGLKTDADERAVRRAYAQRLKAIDQEAEPAAFQRLREDYEAALAWISSRDTDWDEDEEDDLEEDNAEEVPGPVAHATFEAAPLPPDKPTPGQEALEVFRAFEAQVRTWPQDTTVHGGLVAFRALTTVLEDPRLISLEARFQFEVHVAHLLLETGLPGRRALFTAATKVFQWTQDRRRLAALGHAGAVLNREIDQGGPTGPSTFDQETRHQAPPRRTPPLQPSFTYTPLPPPKPPEHQRLYIEALQKVRTGKGAEALPLLDKALTSNPNFAPALTERAILRGNARKTAECLLDLELANTLDPASQRTWFYLGYFKEQAGDHPGALAAYDELLRRNPKDSAAHNNRGNLRMTRLDFDGALEDYDAALAANPRNALALLNRGRLFWVKREREKAALDFEAALKLDPSLQKSLPEELRKPVPTKGPLEALEKPYLPGPLPPSAPKLELPKSP